MHRRAIILASIAVASACGDNGASEEDTGTDDTAAADASSSGTSGVTSSPTSVDASTGSSSDGDVTGTPEGPTYAEDVAPILAAHC